MNTEFVKRMSETLGTELLRKLQPTAHAELILGFDPLSQGGVRLGQSRAGGFPDLPRGLESPSGLSFLCQINLEEVPRLPSCSLLPGRGLLYFFYNTEDQPWGFDPADRGKWAVLYADTPASKLRAMPELLQPTLADSFRIRFLKEQRYSDPEYTSDSFSADEIRDYRYALEEIATGRLDKLMGFPDPIQGGIESQCELASHGVFCGDSSWQDDPAAPVLLEHPDDWRLLLQLDSNTPMGWMWGDTGRLYFMLPADAIERRDFSKAWTVLESY